MSCKAAVRKVSIAIFRVSHGYSWKFLKPHMFEIIRDVLFPILSYSAADEELWNNNPYEYIRVKFGETIIKDFMLLKDKLI